MGAREDIVQIFFGVGLDVRSEAWFWDVSGGSYFGQGEDEVKT